MKGNSARLRASRMRLLMTMSDSGPLALSHSPIVLVRSLMFTIVRGRAACSWDGSPEPSQTAQESRSTSSLIAGFLDAADFVTDLARSFVFLLSNGLFHLSAQADQLSFS